MTLPQTKRPCSTLLALLLLWLATPLLLHAQQRCGTEFPPEMMEQLMEIADERENFAAAARGEFYPLPVVFHVYQDGNGGQTCDQNQVNGYLHALNAAFRPSGMYFYQCDLLTHNDVWNVYNHETQMNQIHSNSLSGPINIHLVVDVINNNPNSNPNGVYHPTADIIVLEGTADTVTAIHEMGHYFGLAHVDGGLGGELVNGSNCHIAGDLICDTDASEPLNVGTAPSLPPPYNPANCSYSSNNVDANGDAYSPPVLNYLVSIAGNCANEFTPGQYNAMLYYLIRYRDALRNHTCTGDLEGAPCGVRIDQFPYISFLDDYTAQDGFTDPIQTHSEWTNVEIADKNWGLPPNNSNSNPCIDNTLHPVYGVGNFGSTTDFAYVRGNGTQPGDLAILASPCFDLTELINPQIRFDAYAGVTGGNNYNPDFELRASIDGGVNWITIWNGNSLSQGTWSFNETVSLSQFGSHTGVRLRFYAGFSDNTMEYALEEIWVEEAPHSGTDPGWSITNATCENADGAISVGGWHSSPHAPWTFLWSDGSTGNSISNLAPGPYSVTITDNNNDQSVIGFVVEWEIMRVDPELTVGKLANGGSITTTWWGQSPPFNVTVTHLITGQVSTSGSISPAPDANGNRSFGFQNLGNPGTYRIDIVDSKGCMQSDTAIIEGNCQTSVNAFPYFQNFEGTSVDWFNDAGLPIDWELGPGSNPSSPTSAVSGTQYMYANSSAMQNPGSFNSRLVGPCFDFSGFSTVTMTFWAHIDIHNPGVLNSANMGVLVTQGGTTSVLATPQPSHPTSGWQQYTADLSPWAGMSDVQIAFQGQHISLFAPPSNTDIGIDDINIQGTLKQSPLLESEVFSSSVSIAPNPGQGVFRLGYERPEDGTTRLRVTDTQGRLVWEADFRESRGVLERTLDLRALGNGLFFLEIFKDDLRHVEKLVITGS